MKRREFMKLVGGAAAAWPLAARAQQPTVPMVGVLFAGASEAQPNDMSAFLKGLSEIGYVDGQSVAVEIRSAAGELYRLPDMVADLIRRRVAVIVTPLSATAAAVAKAATASSRR